MLGLRIYGNQKQLRLCQDHMILQRHAAHSKGVPKKLLSAIASDRRDRWHHWPPAAKLLGETGRPMACLPGDDPCGSAAEGTAEQPGSGNTGSGFLTDPKRNLRAGESRPLRVRLLGG